MWTKSPLLKKFEKLKELGFPLVREPGTKISRGFADLGYEEFLLLSEEKMISLLSGKISALPEEHAKFFFTVPSPDEIVDALSKAGRDIVTLEYKNQRNWELKTSDATGQVAVHEGRTLEEVFYAALAYTYESGEH